MFYKYRCGCVRWHGEDGHVREVSGAHEGEHSPDHKPMNNLEVVNFLYAVRKLIASSDGVRMAIADLRAESSILSSPTLTDW